MREELRERGIKQKDFAKQIGMQATHLSEFIRGKRNLNGSGHEAGKPFRDSL